MRFIVAFYEYPQQRTIYFTKREPLTIDVPTTVFICKEQEVNAFFCMDINPDEDSELYYIPLPNITAGSICNGTAKLSISDYSSLQSIINGYSNFFWHPLFTASELSKQGKAVFEGKAFDDSKLKKAGKLSDIAKKLIPNLYGKNETEQTLDEDEDFDPDEEGLL
jgi:hypothetical protein